MIRNVTIEDIGPLAVLFDQYRQFYQQPANLAGAEAFLQARILAADSQLFVAETTEQVLAGFVQLYPLFSSVQMRRVWLLNDLFVRPANRGQGLSVKLIDRAKAHCQATQAAGLLLETEKTNFIGNQLYPSAGFVRNDTHWFYYWESPDPEMI
ncbi:MAG: GNAT family N-acetyltransferase [Bernardetiaceae bacterium]|jgi:GNAT superfamily N-acetyltransferase|nr:GNAT family N-acetyltransferase [Bernardetiaceae bacterium]